MWFWFYLWMVFHSPAAPVYQQPKVYLLPPPYVAPAPAPTQVPYVNCPYYQETKHFTVSACP